MSESAQMEKEKTSEIDLLQGTPSQDLRSASTHRAPTPSQPLHAVSSDLKQPVKKHQRDTSIAGKKMQHLGRKIVGGFFMITRSLKLYNVDNDVFVKPLHELTNAINQIVAREKRLSLYGAYSTVYLNERLLRLNLTDLENAEYLFSIWEEKGFGGFSTEQAVTVTQLQDFFKLFQEGTQEVEIKQSILKPQILKKVRERIQNQEKKELKQAKSQKANRKKYAVLLYGRLLHHVRAIYNPKESSPTKRKATRILQELIDLCYEKSVQFLGFANEEKGEMYQAFHVANTVLYSLVLGAYLGLTRVQLLDLGMVAVEHDLDQENGSTDQFRYWLNLDEEQSSKLQRSVTQKIQSFLSNQFDWSQLKYAIIVSDLDTYPPKEQLKGLLPPHIQASPAYVYSRIISISACFDALCTKRPYRPKMLPGEALQFMQLQMRKKFDPYLLSNFIALFSPMVSKEFRPKGKKSKPKDPVALLTEHKEEDLQKPSSKVLEQLHQEDSIAPTEELMAENPAIKEQEFLAKVKEQDPQETGSRVKEQQEPSLDSSDFALVEQKTKASLANQAPLTLEFLPQEPLSSFMTKEASSDKLNHKQERLTQQASPRISTTSQKVIRSPKVSTTAQLPKLQISAQNARQKSLRKTPLQTLFPPKVSSTAEHTTLKITENKVSQAQEVKSSEHVQANNKQKTIETAHFVHPVENLSQSYTDNVEVLARKYPYPKQTRQPNDHFAKIYPPKNRQELPASTFHQKESVSQATNILKDRSTLCFSAKTLQASDTMLRAPEALIQSAGSQKSTPIKNTSSSSTASTIEHNSFQLPQPKTLRKPAPLETSKLLDEQKNLEKCPSKTFIQMTPSRSSNALYAKRDQSDAALQRDAGKRKIQTSQIPSFLQNSKVQEQRARSSSCLPAPQRIRKENKRSLKGSNVPNSSHLKQMFKDISELRELRSFRSRTNQEEERLQALEKRVATKIKKKQQP